MSSKALEYTKEIITARLSNSTGPLNKEGGQSVAEFFEAIFNKIVELEKKSSTD